MLTINESRSNEKFSVEKLLESQNLNRNRRKESEEQMETEGTALHLIKKPNLKFGIDSILKEEKKELPLRPVVKYDTYPSMSSALLMTAPTQPEYYYSRNSAPICYESQCISSFNKLSIHPNYHYFYCNSYPSSNTIASNNIGDGNYSQIQGNYNFSTYYNSSGARNGEPSSNSTAKSKKAKWNRAVFTNLQRKGLEKRFSIQKYITKPDRRKLAEMLRLSDSQVKVWFQNRRMKWRHSKEYRDELSKTASNKEQQLITNFPVNKNEESPQS